MEFFHSCCQAKIMILKQNSPQGLQTPTIRIHNPAKLGSDQQAALAQTAQKVLKKVQELSAIPLQ